MMRIVIVATLLALASACGPGRTAAATQPTPKAFDPAGSDAKSLEIVGAMQDKLGSAKWPAVKQIRWVHKTMDGETLKSWLVHSWNIWDGQHRCEVADMTTYQAPSAEKPDPDPPTWIIVMYDLFDVDSGSGYSTVDGNEVAADDRKKFKKQCYTVWKAQSYQLAMLHKLKDPGAKLSHEGELAATELKDIGTVCKDGCNSIKVSFDPAVGTDSWWVHINKATSMPEMLEMQVAKGRIGFVLSDWTEVAGLKFPQKLQNAGLTTEIFQMSEIQIGDPDARLYIPAVK
jgi:hypothetical protein